MRYKLIVYKNPQEFWSKISPYLKPEEAKNSLMLGLSHFGLTNPTGIVYQCALFDENKFIAAMICSKYVDRYNLIISQVVDPQIVQILMEGFFKTKISLSSVIAEATTAKMFSEFLSSNNYQIKHQVDQGIYSCSKVSVPKAEQDVHFRIANLNDVIKLGDWVTKFSEEALPHDPKVDGYKLIENKINMGQAFLLESNKRPVSIACWSRDIGSSCCVNFVYTPEVERKKGYASLVTALLTQKLLSEGKKETNLFTDMSNSTSNKIYQQIGYQFVCRSAHFILYP